MQVGTTKDQGWYNKPSAAVPPGALAAGTLPQYNTIIRYILYIYIMLIIRLYVTEVNCTPEVMKLLIPLSSIPHI